MDFIHDQLATGRKFRILTVLDTWSRYVPAIDARCNYRGEDVVQTMDRICSQTGYPKIIRVDQGSKFISRDLDLWAYANGMTLDFSRLGKPTERAFVRHWSEDNGECVHRGIQGQTSCGVPVGKLFHEPARCPRKAGVLA